MRTPADTPFSPTAARNAAPVLEILRHELHNCRDVLEIGSGTGQHAVFFASEMPKLCWQTSDLDENHAGIEARLAEARQANVLAPLSLDVMCARLSAKYDAVYSANTAHIMSFEAVIKMFLLAGSVLRRKGVFVLYGPFRRFGEFNAPSNARFDASLRAQDPEMGVRDLEELDRAANRSGMEKTGLYAVPSNNLVVVWQKQ